MSNGTIDIPIIYLSTLYIIIGVLSLYLKRNNISSYKELLVAALRMTIQLIIAGFVLDYIFKDASIIKSLAGIIIMLAFTIYTIFSRSSFNLSNELKFLIAISIIFSSLMALSIFIILVLRIKPIYDPKYVLPLLGMILGNSMTSIIICINSIFNKIEDRKNFILSAMMIGLDSKNVLKNILNESFKDAILPQINSMLGMGIVFLPGMMTGQILSGTSPIIAIKYQIGIMLSIFVSVCIANIIITQFTRNIFFDENENLKLEIKMIKK
ncbi:ABC transporter permease [Citroniella saccharovorans]|uniref:ABC transporter permease n=1 Tax=Citroniella saccharovorans TaxID=2053367 RepID=A0AAW9MXX5_9FIRM|nr:ABC transporter permease [Citroniella saccharovorans]MEB3429718.1 ABC transporter permease [Citroniella saccharovorans]